MAQNNRTVNRVVALGGITAHSKAALTATLEIYKIKIERYKKTYGDTLTTDKAIQILENATKDGQDSIDSDSFKDIANGSLDTLTVMLEEHEAEK